MFLVYFTGTSKIPTHFFSFSLEICLQHRDVETVGPVGHGYLRSDSNTVLPVQMFERPLEYLNCYLGDISAFPGPTVKYDLWNSIRISQPIHFCIYLGDLGPFYTLYVYGKSAISFWSVWLSWGLTKILVCQSKWLALLQEFSTCLLKQNCKFGLVTRHRDNRDIKR